jgi:hypothetical protein
MATNRAFDLKKVHAHAALQAKKGYEAQQTKQAAKEEKKRKESQNERARKSRAKRKQTQADPSWSSTVPEGDSGMDQASDYPCVDDDDISLGIPEVDDFVDSSDKQRADQLERNKVAMRGSILAEYYRSMCTTSFAVDPPCYTCHSPSATYKLIRCGSWVCSACIGEVTSHPADPLKVFSQQHQRVLQPFELLTINPVWSILPLLKNCEGCGCSRYKYLPIQNKRLTVVEPDGIWQYQAVNYGCVDCGKVLGYTDPHTYSVGGRYLPGRPKVTSVVVSIDAILRYRRLRHQLPQCTVTAFLKAFEQVWPALI